MINRIGSYLLPKRNATVKKSPSFQDGSTRWLQICHDSSIENPRTIVPFLDEAVGELATARLVRMSDVLQEAAPRAHARIVYLGSVSPHWEVFGDWGDRQVLDDFRARALARLVLLPRDDPQFRRNKERINRDAERELISLEWELGIADVVAE